MVRSSDWSLGFHELRLEHLAHKVQAANSQGSKHLHIHSSRTTVNLQDCTLQCDVFQIRVQWKNCFGNVLVQLNTVHAGLLIHSKGARKGLLFRETKPSSDQGIMRNTNNLKKLRFLPLLSVTCYYLVLRIKASLR